MNTQQSTASLDNISKQAILCSQRECRLLEQLRLIPFGQVTVHLVDGQPIRIEKIKESIQL